MCCVLWQAPRLSYTDNLKIKLHDVLLSTLGKDTVRAMVKEARKVGPEAEESKAGLKQEVSESEEESKVPKEEMAYVEKLENELQKAREALVHERQQKEWFQEAYFQSQRALMSFEMVPNMTEPAAPTTPTGPETLPFDDFPGPESNAAADEADYFNEAWAPPP